MLEYKVAELVLDYMQIQMNAMASQGWRVVSVIAHRQNSSTAYVTFEREIKRKDKDEWLS